MSGFTQINVGTTANDGTGDSLRVGQQAVNSNLLTTVRTLLTVTDLSTEAAASGYSRIVQDLERGGIFKAVNGGTANNGTIFDATTSGWTYQRLFSGAANILWFGCVGDDSTVNNSTLQAACDYCFENGLPLYIPVGTYKVTDFINFYDINIIGDGRDRSIIKSYATNKPVGVFNGSHASVSGVQLRYDSLKTDLSCNTFLFASREGSGLAGWYWSSLRDVRASNGAFNYKCPAGLSTTLSASAASGATTIQVTSLGASSNDQDIIAGNYVKITLDDASTQEVQIDSVSGTTATLREALTGNASSGNAVATKECVFFSNTVDNLYSENWTYYSFAMDGSGTGCSLSNIYSTNGISLTYNQCTGYYRFSTFNESAINQINCEWGTFSESVIESFGCNNLVINSLHMEGLKPSSNDRGLFVHTGDHVTVNGWSIDDWIVPSSITTHALFRNFGPIEGRESINRASGINIKNSKFDNAGSVFWVISTGTGSRVYIEGATVRKDGGMRTTGQLVSPSTASSVLKSLNPVFDESCIAYGISLDLAFTGDRTFYANTRRGSVKSVEAGNSRISLSTAVAGVNTSTGGSGTDIATPEALALITGYDKYLDLSVEGGVSNDIFDWSSNGKLYFEVSTSQSRVTISGTSVSVQRFNEAINGFGIQRITLDSVHGLNVGDIVLISGATDTDFNGQFKVVDTPSDYAFDFYKYTGTTKALTLDAGITVQKVPTVDVFVKGIDWDKPNY